MTVFRDSKWMTSNLVFLVLRARRVVYRWWVGTALPGLGMEHEKIGHPVYRDCCDMQPAHLVVSNETWFNSLLFPFGEKVLKMRFQKMKNFEMNSIFTENSFMPSILLGTVNVFYLILTIV